MALVDDDKWHELMELSWCMGSGGYVLTKTERTTVNMHRLLLKAEEAEIVDHINHVRHDNRLSNLRISTYSGNAHNKAKKEKPTSKFFGVHKVGGKVWRSTVTKDGVTLDLGRFMVEEHAAIAYDIKASELHGAAANLNNVAYDESTLQVIKSKISLVGQKKPDASSPFRGVCWCKTKRKWKASINKDRLQFRVFRFSC